MKSLKFIVLILLAVSCVSCKHKPKKPVDTPPISDSVSNTVFYVSQEDADLINEFHDNLKLDTFNKVEVKFNLDFQSATQSHSGSGTLRMVNDSLIWMSVSALGLEVGRALFTPDSVMFIFKLKNKYFAGDYSYLKNFIPVDIDFNILQSIFLDKFFIFPENNEQALLMFTPKKTDNVYTFSTFGRPEYPRSYGMNSTIVYDANIKKMTQNSAVFASNNKGVKITYSGFKDFSYHNLPTEVALNGVGNDFSLVFNYQKVTFGKKMSFNFSIPNNYKPFEF